LAQIFINFCLTILLHYKFHKVRYYLDMITGEIIDKIIICFKINDYSDNKVLALSFIT